MTWFIEILKAIFFGIIEGITEWLPISSTGHMILFEQPLGVTSMFSRENCPDYGVDFWNMFLVVIQLGAIIAVIIYFWKKLWPFSRKLDSVERGDIWSRWGKTLVGVIPAAVFGFFLDDLIDQYLFNSVTVAITLIFYGIIFIVLEIWNKKRSFTTSTMRELTYQKALLIGFFQVLALIPGTSRSGITIIGAMLLLCEREVAAEYSFYLSIPVMFGASLLKGAKFFLKYGMIGAHEAVFLAVGCIVAFVVSLFAVKWLMGFVKKHDFKPFGIYRILLGIVVLIVFFCTR